MGGNVWGAFNRPSIQTPSFMKPYTMSTGGANAIVAPTQTARIPQARPPGLQWSQLQQALPAATLMQQLHDQMRRDSAAASQSSRSGTGYSGGGGGGYVGGGYGGAGGRSIASGVGGAFKNR
jgi:hypothetical protein